MHFCICPVALNQDHGLPSAEFTSMWNRSMMDTFCSPVMGMPLFKTWSDWQTKKD